MSKIEERFRKIDRESEEAEEAFPLAVIRSLLILFAIALVKLSFALRVVLVFRNERRKFCANNTSRF